MPHETFWQPDRNATLGAARNWLLLIGCWKSVRVTTYRVTELADQYGSRVSIGDIIRRMRCRGCSGPPTSAELVTEEKQGRSARHKRVPIRLS